MAPDGSTDFACKTCNAMKVVQGVVFQSSGMLAGPSSGLNVIRALLATPSTDSLFESVILQSGRRLLHPSTQSSLQTHFYGLINRANGSDSCTSAFSLASDAHNFDPSLRNGALITSALELTALPFTEISKPLLLTNVANEAVPMSYGNMPALGAKYFFNIAAASYGDDRTEMSENST
ncbi:hypothetical protein EV715DRAFT_298024 [Schizophyllum commune]